MPEISKEDLDRLTRLWAETFLRVQEMGKLILKNQPTAKVFDGKMGIGELELDIVKRDKEGNIVHTQKIKSTGSGQILSHKRWDNDGGK